MNKIFNASLLLILSAGASQALAWGSTGHRVIGLVAERHMDPAALKKAHAILDNHDLAFVSTWPDEIRSDPKNFAHTFNWHFTTWQDEDDGFHAGLENKSTGFLLTQIEKQIAVLKNPAASQSEKAFALKFTIHLIGDVHQPLHVGTSGDRGGNACRVTWHGKPSNLHTVWDSDMIEKTNLSFTELADFASQNRSQKQTRQWQSGTVKQWSEESKILRSRIYPAEVVAPSAPVTYLTYCQDKVEPEAMPKLGYEYSFEFDPVVRERLYQAGVRLAKVLNEAL
jgi:hypothetical protein